jgi:hypothetical protein
MTLEDKFKKQLGEMSFTITVLQHQLEETTQELNALKADKAEKKQDVRSTKS